MGERLNRTASLAGEGALAGLAAGATIGAWAVRLHQDLEHGTLWLAAERLAGPSALGALAGAAVSLLLAALLGRLARRSGALAILAFGVLDLVPVGAFLYGLLVDPEDFFPLARFSTPRLLAGVIGGVCVVPSVLLLRRLLEALRSAASREPATASSGERASPAARTATAASGGSGGVIAAALPPAGLGLAAAAILAWTALPWLGAARARGRPSIILVSLDTLRADRTGFLKSGCPLTPELDALAAEGLVFEQAVACSPWTLPSHVSLFLSALPFDHHVRWTTSHIPPERLLLAEALANAGYRTAAFTGNGYVGAWYGFDQGFGTYEDHVEHQEGGPEKIIEGALAWGRAHRDEPFFLFVHTYEPHSPYRHRDRAREEDRGRLPETFEWNQVTDVQEGRIVLTEQERRYVTDLYEGDIAFTDARFGGMLRTMKDEGILDRALLLVLSDHGEDLWDHETGTRSPGHGHSLYEELIRVPMFARLPGRIPAGARVRGAVSLLDVAPTLLEIVAVPPAAAFAGRSLAPTWTEGIEPAPAAIYSESVEYGPDRFALREGNLKVIVTPFPEHVHNNVKLDVRPLEVFDLAADPGEQHDLSASPPPGAHRLIEEIDRRARRILRVHAERKAEPAGPPPEEVLEGLRGLGYVH